MSEITVNVDPENIPVVQIVVDENSAQSAIDAAAAAQAALDAIANTNFGDKLDKGGYVGTAQTLKDDIDAIVLPDDILVHGAAPVTNGTVNIAANAFEWRLSQIVYNNSAYSNLINPAANGSSRIDLFCLNNLGTLEKVVGDELIGIAPEPAPNPGTLGAFFVAVNGAVIGAPSPIMTSNKPILEREKQPFQVYNTGEINDTYLDDFFYGYLNFRGAVTDLKSCRVYQNTFLYSGKEILVKNSQATDITIFHLNGLGFQFSFPNAENLVLKPNEIIRFSMKITDPSSGVLEYVGRMSAVASVAVADVVGLPAALATKVTQTEIDALGTQLLGGAPADANTLKELNDKILAVQAIIGGATADGGVLVNTVAELLAVFSTYSEGVDLVSLLAGKANIASPTFTGTPLAPTATVGTNTTQLATTAFVLANSQAKGIRVTNATTTGSYAIDWNAADVWRLTLTGATTITDTNLPTGTATKVIELVVNGSFAITFPAYWEAKPSSQAYLGTKKNHIIISCIIGTAASELVYYSNEVGTT